MAIPESSFVVSRRSAKLHLEHLPLSDSFFFGNCQGVASQVSTTVTWRATGRRPHERGQGGAVEPTSPAAFVGRFSDATCEATVSGNQTGFCFETKGVLDASGFFAEFGEQANGVFM
jgi:hypothetical protein